MCSRTKIAKGIEPARPTSREPKPKRKRKKKKASGQDAEVGWREQLRRSRDENGTPVPRGILNN